MPRADSSALAARRVNTLRNDCECKVVWVTMYVCGVIFQARTLRLLAHAYLEWDSRQYWQKALNAIGLANAVSLRTIQLAKSVLIHVANV